MHATPQMLEQEDSSVLELTATSILPISSLQAADSPRLDGENPEHIRILAASDTAMPPILVHRPTLRVIDGMHRLRAALLRGNPTVEVEFFEGTDEEAFLAAVKANVTHGLPLTLADREAAALRLIRSDPRRSDRMLANVTGLSSSTIAALRRRAGEQQEVTARIGRDGRIRPVDIAEGRRRAQQEIENNPGASLREIARAAGISLATASDVRRRIRSGEDPVPESGRNAGPRRIRDAQINATRDSKDVTSLLSLLRKDPALRYSDPGRALLRCLEFHVRGPVTVQSLADSLPPHCRFSLARLIHSYAEEWRKLAMTLERSAS